MRIHMVAGVQASMLLLQLRNPLFFRKLPSFLNQLLFVELQERDDMVAYSDYLMLHRV